MNYSTLRRSWNLLPEALWSTCCLSHFSQLILWRFRVWILWADGELSFSFSLPLSGGANSAWRRSVDAGWRSSGRINSTCSTIMYPHVSPVLWSGYIWVECCAAPHPQISASQAALMSHKTLSSLSFVLDFSIFGSCSCACGLSSVFSLSRAESWQLFRTFVWFWVALVSPSFSAVRVQAPVVFFCLLKTTWKHKTLRCLCVGGWFLSGQIYTLPQTWQH